MAFRTLEITNPSELHVKDGQLIIEQKDKKISIPLEDIHNIICMGSDIRISTMAMTKLVEKGITMMMLDEIYKVSGILTAVTANSKQTEVLHKQIEFDNICKAEVWSDIIKAKILNQGRVLSILGLNGADEVMSIALEMRCDGEDKAEAYAARKYFQYLHPGLSRRVIEPFNSHLNYGYAVLRNTIIRELISTGLQPALGLHHCNQFNSFNLADDLIEPWRPMVDLIAYKNVDSNVVLTKGQRYELAHVVHNACDMNNKKMCIISGIELMIDSFKRTVIEKTNNLVLPTVIPIESMELLNE